MKTAICRIKSDTRHTRASRIDQLRSETLNPPVKRDVMGLDAALSEQLLQVPIRQVRSASTSAPTPHSPHEGNGNKRKPRVQS